MKLVREFRMILLDQCGQPIHFTEWTEEQVDDSLDRMTPLFFDYEKIDGVNHVIPVATIDPRAPYRIVIERIS